MSLGFNVNQNKGLSYLFSLEEGSFKLTGGGEKARDNLFFFLGFVLWFRVYYEDYIPGIGRLIQKPTSMIQSLQTVIIGGLQTKLRKYLPHLQVDNITVGRDRGTKDFALVIDYTFDLEPDTKVQTVSFIQV